MPRYDYINQPGTGLVAAQVTLEDGTMYHSPHPCGDKEQASEIAARVALESLGLLPGGQKVGNRDHRRGRGRGHRGHRGRDGDNPNQYQPWAEYSGHYPAVRQRTDNRQLAGTDQMDIRYRDKQPDPKLSASDPLMKEIEQKQKVSKPAFVPLQVSRKAVKPVEKKAEVKDIPEVAAVKSEASEKVVTPSPRSSASKESTPQRSLAKGQSAPKQGRKMRMAANFGGDEN